MRRGILRVGRVGLALTALGLLVAASGVVSIRASSGHWPMTRWLIEFAKRRSVSTWSMGVHPPDLADPALVTRGAGLYEGGCRPCHGAPGERQSEVVRHMLPHPPWLPDEVTEWDAEQLFQIVKHGLKFTGMPAWPAPSRDDEVWAAVAFLRALPELDGEAYRRLAFGETAGSVEAPEPMLLEDPPGKVLEVCSRCHGTGGRGRGDGAFPSLAGQRPAYLRAALEAYARGERASGIMGPVAAALGEESIAGLARWFASLPAPGGGRVPEDAPAPPAATPTGAGTPRRAAVGSPPDPGAIERGRAIAERGIPARKVPSCADCHGPAEGSRNPRYPLLAGQHADYLVQQLLLFADGRRGGSSYASIMQAVAGRLAPEDMKDVALYYGSLAAAPADGAETAPGG